MPRWFATLWAYINKTIKQKEPISNLWPKLLPLFNSQDFIFHFKGDTETIILPSLNSRHLMAITAAINLKGPAQFSNKETTAQSSQEARLLAYSLLEKQNWCRFLYFIIKKQFPPQCEYPELCSHRHCQLGPKGHSKKTLSFKSQNSFKTELSREQWGSFSKA